MHKVFKYIIIFIIVYFSVNILTYLIMRSTRSNKTVELNIPGNSPSIQITQARGSTEGGIIRGKITNNSNQEIMDTFLKLRFFSKRGVEMGNQYITIKSLKPGETMEFIADYSYRMVDRITGELMTKEALIGEINKATNNGKSNDKFNFSKLDLSKVNKDSFSSYKKLVQNGIIPAQEKTQNKDFPYILYAKNRIPLLPYGISVHYLGKIGIHGSSYDFELPASSDIAMFILLK